LISAQDLGALIEVEAYVHESHHAGVCPTFSSRSARSISLSTEMKAVLNKFFDAGSAVFRVDVHGGLPLVGTGGGSVAREQSTEAITYVALMEDGRLTFYSPSVYALCAQDGGSGSVAEAALVISLATIVELACIPLTPEISLRYAIPSGNAVEEVVLTCRNARRRDAAFLILERSIQDSKFSSGSEAERGDAFVTALPFQ